MNKEKSYATFWERLLSRMIDVSVYFLIVFIPFIKITETTEINILLNNLLNFVLFVLFVSVLILPLEIIMVSKFGGTVGKLLMGIAIQKENGAHLNFKESFIRLTLGKAVSGLFFSLGYIWIFKNDKGQAWHDIIGEAVVVRKLSFGWIIGLLILFVFSLIDIVIFSGSIAGFISNSNLYGNLLSL